ncbi:ATP-binding protein [Larkinella sp. GY13]|uniref:ATP-binding protein n=1 Tax=Larkinella sp. GY13 TaxID=3453720 RepID=UPI003EE93BD8
MTEQELQNFLLQSYPKENEACEWKAFQKLKHSVSGHSGDDVLSYVSALANMRGGCLIMGVEDKRLSILGIEDTASYTPDNLPHYLRNNCPNLSSEGLYVEEIITSDTLKRVWLIHIPQHLPRKPVYAHRMAWQRSGDSLIALTSERENIILQEPLGLEDDWSAGTCVDATIDDLDPIAIERARNNYKEKFPKLANEVDNWDDTTFLNKAFLTKRGRITRTSIILLGRPESEHFINPAMARIRWILKDKDNVEKDYEHFSCPFLLTVANVYQKIRNLRYRYIRENTLFPDEVDQYHPFVVRESLHNCIAHQDYALKGYINVVEREDGKLVFTNAGTFLPGSIENVVQQDAPPEFVRNPFLVRAMLNLNMIDTIGSGIRRMMNYQREKYFPLPDYEFPNQRVQVTIIGKVLDLDYALVLAQNPDLSLDEIIMLDKLQKKKHLHDWEISKLRKRKLIEGKKPFIYISANVAAKIGQQVEYIHNIGIDDDYCQKIIVDYLKRFRIADREKFDSVLFAKLSDRLTEEQKKNKVKNALQSLRRQGIIVLTADRHWVLADKATS